MHTTGHKQRKNFLSHFFVVHSAADTANKFQTTTRQHFPPYNPSIPSRFQTANSGASSPSLSQQKREKAILSFLSLLSPFGDSSSSFLSLPFITGKRRPTSSLPNRTTTIITHKKGKGPLRKGGRGSCGSASFFLPFPSVKKRQKVITEKGVSL